MTKKTKKFRSSKNYDQRFQELQREKMHYQMAGQYLKAQQIFEKIEQLKSNITQSTNSKRKTKQNKQSNALKKRQKNIMNEFENDWKRRLKSFEKNCFRKTLSNLECAQLSELAEESEQLQYKLNQKNIKYPPKILAARDKELALARLNKFNEAFDVQQHRIFLEEQAFDAYACGLQRKYDRIISKKKRDHCKQRESLIKRLECSRAELMREYNKQKTLLIKRQKTMLDTFQFNQKRLGNQQCKQNEQHLAKTYVGTHHGGHGTVSKLRPWTFRVNDQSLSPRKVQQSGTIAPIPNEDIAEIESYIVSEYKKENKVIADEHTKISFGAANKIVSFAAKWKRRRNLKKAIMLAVDEETGNSENIGAFGGGSNRLTNLISQIENMKLFESKAEETENGAVNKIDQMLKSEAGKDGSMEMKLAKVVPVYDSVESKQFAENNWKEMCDSLE